jgi:hypothetical protein
MPAGIADHVSDHHRSGETFDRWRGGASAPGAEQENQPLEQGFSIPVSHEKNPMTALIGGLSYS